MQVAPDNAAAEEPFLQRADSHRLAQPTMLRQLSHHFVPEDQTYTRLNGEVPAHIKADFVRKVYALLATEILYTAAICAVFCFYAPLRHASINFLLEHTTVFKYSLIFSMMASICALTKNKNKYPLNLFFTAIFCSLMGVNIGVICAVYQETGNGALIVEAVAITAAIFLSLTAYCWISKNNFSFMGGFLFVALFANIFVGFGAIITGSTLVACLYQVFGVLIFVGYVLYDTSNIIHKYGPDDYIIASIELYLDIINLFLYILSLLGKR